MSNAGVASVVGAVKAPRSNAGVAFAVVSLWVKAVVSNAGVDSVVVAVVVNALRSTAGVVVVSP